MQWNEGLIVNIFKKGDREDSGKYTEVSVYSVL